MKYNAHPKALGIEVKGRLEKKMVCVKEIDLCYSLFGWI